MKPNSLLKFLATLALSVIQISAWTQDSQIKNVNVKGNVIDVRGENANIDHFFYCGAVSGSFITDTKDYGVPFVSDHYPVTCTFIF